MQSRYRASTNRRVTYLVLDDRVKCQGNVGTFLLSPILIAREIKDVRSGATRDRPHGRHAQEVFHPRDTTLGSYLQVVPIMADGRCDFVLVPLGAWWWRARIHSRGAGSLPLLLLHRGRGAASLPAGRTRQRVGSLRRRHWHAETVRMFAAHRPRVTRRRIGERGK
jgi:hypothetical protein